MARTAVTPTTLGPNTGAAKPAGTTIDSTLVTNGVIITGVPLEELILEVTNTFDGAKDVTIQSGDSPPALEAGVGDLVVEVADGDPTPATALIGPFTSGRFIQSGGTEAGALHVDFESGFTGTIRAYRISRAA